MTLVRTYATRALADAAVAALPGATYLRREREGTDWTCATPGNAIGRIRARGVLTERPIEVLRSRDGRHAVPVPLVVGTVRIATPQGPRDERTVTPGTDPLADEYDGPDMERKR